MRSLKTAVVTLALLAAACGGGEATTDAASQTTPADSPTASPTLDDQLQVVLQDGGFLPREVSIVAGGTLELKNNGLIPHTFTVEAADIDMVLQPGGAETVTVTAAAGTYDLICRFHENMRGTLTVTG